MLKEIIIAIQSYIEAHQFIRRHRLWKWILIPGIIYMLLFATGMYFFWSSSNEAVNWLTRTVGLGAWLQEQHNEWFSFLVVMAGLFLQLISMLFYFSLFKYLFLIVGSPVFAYLSEKTAAILEGKDFPFSFPQLVKDIWRGTKLAIRNTLWQTVYMFSLLLLSLVPVVGGITIIVAVFIECYYYGFSMLDYSCERNRLTMPESIDFIGKHRGLAIGNGLMFFLMHGLLIVGWVLAPAYAVVAATLSLHKINKAA